MVELTVAFPIILRTCRTKLFLQKKNGSENLNWRPANLHESFLTTVSVYTLSRKGFMWTNVTVRKSRGGFPLNFERALEHLIQYSPVFCYLIVATKT
jgi:hypothetical protein